MLPTPTSHWIFWLIYLTYLGPAFSPTLYHTIQAAAHSDSGLASLPTLIYLPATIHLKLLSASSVCMPHWTNTVGPYVSGSCWCLGILDQSSCYTLFIYKFIFWRCLCQATLWFLTLANHVLPSQLTGLSRKYEYCKQKNIFEFKSNKLKLSFWNWKILQIKNVLQGQQCSH